MPTQEISVMHGCFLIQTLVGNLLILFLLDDILFCNFLVLNRFSRIRFNSRNIFLNNGCRCKDDLKHLYELAPLASYTHAHHYDENSTFQLLFVITNTSLVLPNCFINNVTILIIK